MSISAPTGLGKMCGCCARMDMPIFLIACKPFSGRGTLLLSDDHWLKHTWSTQWLDSVGNLIQKTFVDEYNRYTNALTKTEIAFNPAYFEPNELFETAYTTASFLADAKALLNAFTLDELEARADGYICNEGFPLVECMVFSSIYDTAGNISLKTDGRPDDWPGGNVTWLPAGCASFFNTYTAFITRGDIGMQYWGVMLEKSRIPLGFYNELVDGQYCKTSVTGDINAFSNDFDTSYISTDMSGTAGTAIDYEPDMSWNGMQTISISAGECNPAP